jgi:hypothetical protein
MKKKIFKFYYTKEHTSMFVVCFLPEKNITLEINSFNKMTLNVEWIIQRYWAVLGQMHYIFLCMKKYKKFLIQFWIG